MPRWATPLEWALLDARQVDPRTFQASNPPPLTSTTVNRLTSDRDGCTMSDLRDGCQVPARLLAERITGRIIMSIPQSASLSGEVSRAPPVRDEAQEKT